LLAMRLITAAAYPEPVGRSSFTAGLPEVLVRRESMGIQGDGLGSAVESDRRVSVDR